MLSDLADEALADRNDPTIGDRPLFSDGTWFVVPARRLKQGYNILSTGVGLGWHGRDGGDALLFVGSSTLQSHRITGAVGGVGRCERDSAMIRANLRECPAERTP